MPYNSKLTACSFYFILFYIGTKLLLPPYLELPETKILSLVLIKFELIFFISVVQNLWSRTGIFDNNMLPFVTVEQVAEQLKPAGYWLNIQVE